MHVIFALTNDVKQQIEVSIFVDCIPPYAGITRIRFIGFDLSPIVWGTPILHSILQIYEIFV